jgi:hypothetical protein
MNSALWRRLDTPGHDGAHVSRVDDGWRLEGLAVFAHELGPARLSYWVECASDWRTRGAGVAGWVGAQRCDVSVTRSESGQWRLGNQIFDDLSPCLDVDFGFTPATNYLQIHRNNLAIGKSIEFPVAWLDLPEAELISLPQHYERRSATTYWYESPQNSYAAMLELADSGFVRSYPELWALEE